MMYILIFIIAIFISYFFFKKITNMNLIKLNFISIIFYREILLFVGIGSLLIVLKQDYHYIISKWVSNQIRVEGYYYIILFIVFFPILMCLFLKLLKLNLKYLDYSFRLEKIKQIISKNDDEIYWGCCFFLILAIFSGIYVFYKIGCIPILEIFSGKSLIKLRIDITRNFQGNVYIKNLVFLLIPPIFTFITYIYWRKLKSIKWRILFNLFFLLTFLSKTHNLEKSPFFFFIINFYLLKILLENGIKKKQIYFVIIGIIVGMGIIYKVKNQPLFTYNQGIIGRIILSQIAGFYTSLEIFPKIHSFLNIGTSKSMARIIMEIINPKGVEAGVAGVMNSLFIAEAYSYLSTIGIYLSLIYVPFVFVVFCKIISLLRRTPITLAIYSYIGFSYLTQNLTGGIIAYIYSPVLIVILGYVILLYIIGNLLKRN